MKHLRSSILAFALVFLLPLQALAQPLFFDGFESGGIAAGDGPWTVNTAAGGGSVTLSSALKHGGGFSAECVSGTGGASGDGQIIFPSVDWSATTTPYFRGYLYVSAVPSTIASGLLGIADLGSTGGSLIYLLLTASSGVPALQLAYASGGAGGTVTTVGSPYPIATGAWYMVQMRGTINASTGAAALLVNGISAASASSLNLGSTGAALLTVGSYFESASTITSSATFYWDDIFVSGSAFAGPGQTVALAYTSATPTENAWTKVPSGDTMNTIWNHQPFSASFDVTSATASQEQTGVLSATSMDGGTTVASSGSVLNGYKIGIVGKTSSTTTDGADSALIDLSSTITATALPSVWATTTAYKEVYPSTSATIATLIAGQAGVEYGTATETHTASAVYLMLDYSPPIATSGTIGLTAASVSATRSISSVARAATVSIVGLALSAVRTGAADASATLTLAGQAISGSAAILEARSAAVAIAGLSISASRSVSAIARGATVTLASLSVSAARNLSALARSAAVTISSVAIAATRAVGIASEAAITLAGAAVSSSRVASVARGAAISLSNAAISAARTVSAEASAQVVLVGQSIAGSRVAALSRSAAMSLGGLAVSAIRSVSAVSRTAAVAISALAISGSRTLSSIVISASATIALGAESISGSPAVRVSRNAAVAFASEAVSGLRNLSSIVRSGAVSMPGEGLSAIRNVGAISRSAAITLVEAAVSAARGVRIVVTAAVDLIAIAVSGIASVLQPQIFPPVVLYAPIAASAQLAAPIYSQAQVAAPLCDQVDITAPLYATVTMGAQALFSSVFIGQ